VVVASWGEEPLPSGGHADVGGWLQQHGIAAEVQRHRHAPHDLQAALTALCRHEKAGLLVMGCYSHTRLRERVLGGATRAMLQALPLPVLMAH
jgi:nucleotide-binding universal stress UspA family protein